MSEFACEGAVEQSGQSGGGGEECVEFVVEEGWERRLNLPTRCILLVDPHIHEHTRIEHHVGAHGTAQLVECLAVPLFDVLVVDGTVIDAVAVPNSCDPMPTLYIPPAVRRDAEETVPQRLAVRVVLPQIQVFGIFDIVAELYPPHVEGLVVLEHTVEIDAQDLRGAQDLGHHLTILGGGFVAPAELLVELHLPLALLALAADLEHFAAVIVEEIVQGELCLAVLGLHKPRQV